MDERVEASIAQSRVNSLLVTTFGALALLLAAIGIYAVLSYTISQRTREIGIRMALGAQRRDVLRLVVRQGMAPALLGIGAGLALALVSTRLLRSLLFGVGALDPATFAFVATALGLVALVACLTPARRAAAVDPNVALRTD
jgi:putative ABC transport system permease protein